MFNLQTYSQIKKSNNKIKAYLQIFINFEPKNLAKFLLIAKFTYNNTNKTRTNYIFFKLNCDY